MRLTRMENRRSIIGFALWNILVGIGAIIAAWESGLGLIPKILIIGLSAISTQIWMLIAYYFATKQP